MGPDELLEESGSDDGAGRHEPDEPDLGPSPPDPNPNPETDLNPAPEVDGMLGPIDAPSELLVGFWSLVVLFNVGLFGLAVGPMLLFFRGDWMFGGALTALGLLATAHGVHRYRTLQRQDDLWAE